jgi:hypothetical protein
VHHRPCTLALGTAPCHPTAKPVPHAVPSPSPPRGHLRLPDPPFSSPSPVFIPCRARPSPPAPLASCPLRRHHHTTGNQSRHHRFSTPSVSSAAPPSSFSFGPHLTPVHFLVLQDVTAVAVAIGGAPRHQNAVAEAAPSPSSLTHYCSEDLVVPPCSATSPRCPSRGGEDLVDREAVSEPRGDHAPRRAGERATSAAGLGQQAEAVGRSRPATVRGFFIFVFFYISKNSYKLQKCIENIIKLKKYEVNFYRMLKTRPTKRN